MTDQIFSAMVFETAAALAKDYVSNSWNGRVAPGPSDVKALSSLGGSIPEMGHDPVDTVRLLDEYGSPATVASTGGRFFGLVVGGTLPAALGASVLTAAWDQVVFNASTSPVGTHLETVAGAWILDVLGLPEGASVSFVTGATMGNFTCLAAARNALLRRQGWDVGAKGLSGAPPLRVVTGAEVHVTVKKALRLLGLGTDCIEYVPCDTQGRLVTEALPPLDTSTIVIAQAGNVNSGASDPVGAIADSANGAWVHVDGAFGLWAAASKATSMQLAGLERADSWVTDGHKWLNTPYDCGIAVCRDPAALYNAMATRADYLEEEAVVAPKDRVPEFSRSARGVWVWAALHSLGRNGLAELVDRCSSQARRIAKGLQALGFEVLNEVCLNQVVATLPGREHHSAAIAEHVQASGEAWFGTTIWQGRQAIRLSVSSWATTESDINRTLEAISSALYVARDIGSAAD